MPIDLKYAHDFAQQVIEQVQWGINNIKVHPDYIGVFGNTKEEHQILHYKFYLALKQKALP